MHRLLVALPALFLEQMSLPGRSCFLISCMNWFRSFSMDTRNTRLNFSQHLRRSGSLKEAFKRLSDRLDEIVLLLLI